IRSADLQLTKDDNTPGFVAQGLLPVVNYGITVHNNGPGPASPTITMTDLIPAGTTLLSATVPAGWLCTPTSGAGPTLVTCTTTLTMPAGTTASFLFLVQFLSGIPAGTHVTNC